MRRRNIPRHYIHTLVEEAGLLLWSAYPATDLHGHLDALRNAA
jgi:hypothetical protein